MASKRMLPHTITLFNYKGEVDRKACYTKTFLRNVYAPCTIGASLDDYGRKNNSTATLFIFHNSYVAEDEFGNKKRFVTYETWKNSDDKDAYWTLSDKGDDYFVIGRCDDATPPKEAYAFRIKSFNELKIGTKRMWHWEVTGR